MSKPAKIVISRIDSRTERVEIRSGAKGTGEQLWGCQYWPDSARSVEQKDEYLYNEIERLEADGYSVSW